MNQTELLMMTVAELKALAKKKGVTVGAGAKKADIIKALAGGGKPVRKKAAQAGSAAAKKKAPAAKKRSGKPTVKREPAVRKAAKTPVRKAAAPKAPSGEKREARMPAAMRQMAEQPSAIRREWQAPPPAGEPLRAQERVADAKYRTGTPEQRPAASAGSLPRSYGKARVTLLARDPRTVFASWEVPAEALQRGRAALGGDSAFFLRFYDVTGVRFDGSNATAYCDRQVSEPSGSRYFELDRPGRELCADVGLLARNGTFRTLARSNILTLPRGGISDILDEEGAVLDEEMLSFAGGAVSSMQARELGRKKHLAAVSSPGLFREGKTARR